MNGTRVPGGVKAGIVIGAAIAMLGVAVGAAVASIPASAGTINACYSTTTGALRVIDYPSHHCGSGERFLRWNQTSVAGAVPLLAVQGTSCSSIGAQGKVYLDVAPSTGVVTLACKVLLKVQSSLTLSKVDLYAGISGQPARECDNTTGCSVALPYLLPSAQVALKATSAFRYTCPGAGTQQSYADVTRTVFQGTCTGILMNADRTVVVAQP